MNRLLPILAALLLVSLPTYAAQPIVVYSGTAAANGLTLFTTEDMTEFNVCNLVSTVGAVTLEVSYDGTVFYQHHLEDKAATTLDPVLTTTQGKPYAYVGVAKKLRVVAAGGAATAVLRCGRIG